MHLTILPQILNPLIGLALWINNQRPPSTIEDENTIIDGEVVGGEAVFLPVSDNDLLGEDTGEEVVGGDGDFILAAFVGPVSDHHGPVFVGEGADVGDRGGGQDDVADETLLVLLEFGDVDFPSLGLAS